IGRPADDLLGDLPLTERTPEGALRLHALWEPALRRRLDPDDRRQALRRGAAELLGRGDVRRAFDASAAAGDLDGQRAAVRAALAQPLMRTRLDDLRYLGGRLPPELDVEATLLRAFLSLGGPETTAIERFEQAAALARARDDAESECLALWRLQQSEFWAGNPEHVPALNARLEELAARGVARAEMLVAIEAAAELGRRGRREEALLRMHALEQDGRTALLAETLNLRAGVVFGLGCPEDVLPPGFGPNELLQGSGDDPRSVLGHALWLRGEVAPEAALAIGRELAREVVATRITHQHVALLGVLSRIAVHAGDLDAAEDLLDEGKGLVGDGLTGHAGAFLRVADASLAVGRHEEARAAELLDTTLRTLAMETLPAMAYLTVLPMLHLLAPGTREAIDHANVGPTLTVVRDVARALTALREHGDVAPAAALPWRRANLLRAHVAPPHLAELAVGALAGGAGTADAVLEALPERRAQLQWTASTHRDAVAELARQRLAAIPARPRQVVHVDLFGGPTLSLGGVVVADGAWKRERVRQILCFLLTHPVTTRHELMEALWPDLDEQGAGGNLRTNLAHLQRALQPDRGRDEAPWFVRTDGEMLSLCTDGLTTDVERFDVLVEEGRRFEDRGVPGTALARYLEAVELYSGDYLAGFDDSWAAYERIRLRSAFVAAATRAGELLLARGEPEQALRLADRVAAVDELAERAHRLRIQCLLAVGDRSAARTSGERLLVLLARADLAPERETVRLVSPLGL
ncbi:MAG TPA: BTAD domain-containing putative transcriptional regulator, partial [Acidimicrobiia bacterium]